MDRLPFTALPLVYPIALPQFVIEAQLLPYTALVTAKEVDLLRVEPVGVRRVGATTGAGERFGFRIEGDPLETRAGQDFHGFSWPLPSGGKVFHLAIDFAAGNLPGTRDRASGVIVHAVPISVTIEDQKIAVDFEWHPCYAAYFGRIRTVKFISNAEMIPITAPGTAQGGNKFTVVRIVSRHGHMGRGDNHHQPGRSAVYLGVSSFPGSR